MELITISELLKCDSQKVEEVKRILKSIDHKKCPIEIRITPQSECHWITNGKEQPK